MITYYGLDEKIGNLSYYDSSPNRDYSFGKPYSEKTAELIDQRVRELIDDVYNQAKQILLDNREKLDKLAKILIDKEVIFREDVEEIYGPRQWDDGIEGIKDMVNKKDEDKTKDADSTTTTDTDTTADSTTTTTNTDSSNEYSTTITQPTIDNPQPKNQDTKDTQTEDDN